MQQGRPIGLFKWSMVIALPFLIGYSGVLQTLAQSVTYWFNLYAEAELKKYHNAHFINEQGQAEYVVALADNKSAEGRALLENLEGIASVRETLFDQWFVVALAPGGSVDINALQSEPFVDFALPNRGVWFCH